MTTEESILYHNDDVDDNDKDNAEPTNDSFSNSNEEIRQLREYIDIGDRENDNEMGTMKKRTTTKMILIPYPERPLSAKNLFYSMEYHRLFQANEAVTSVSMTMSKFTTTNDMRCTEPKRISNSHIHTYTPNQHQNENNFKNNDNDKDEEDNNDDSHSHGSSCSCNSESDLVDVPVPIGNITADNAEYNTFVNYSTSRSNCNKTDTDMDVCTDTQTGQLLHNQNQNQNHVYTKEEVELYITEQRQPCTSACAMQTQDTPTTSSQYDCNPSHSLYSRYDSHEYPNTYKDHTMSRKEMQLAMKKRRQHRKLLYSKKSSHNHQQRLQVIHERWKNLSTTELNVIETCCTNELHLFQQQLELWIQQNPNHIVAQDVLFQRENTKNSNMTSSTVNTTANRGNSSSSSSTGSHTSLPLDHHPLFADLSEQKWQYTNTTDKAIATTTSDATNNDNEGINEGDSTIKTTSDNTPTHLQSDKQLLLQQLYTNESSNNLEMYYRYNYHFESLIQQQRDGGGVFKSNSIAHDNAFFAVQDRSIIEQQQLVLLQRQQRILQLQQNLFYQQQVLDYDMLHFQQYYNLLLQHNNYKQHTNANISHTNENNTSTNENIDNDDLLNKKRAASAAPIDSRYKENLNALQLQQHSSHKEYERRQSQQSKESYYTPYRASTSTDRVKQDPQMQLHYEPLNIFGKSVNQKQGSHSSTGSIGDYFVSHPHHHQQQQYTGATITLPSSEVHMINTSIQHNTSPIWFEVDNTQRCNNTTPCPVLPQSVVQGKKRKALKPKHTHHDDDDTAQKKSFASYP